MSDLVVPVTSNSNVWDSSEVVGVKVLFRAIGPPFSWFLGCVSQELARLNGAMWSLWKSCSPSSQGLFWGVTVTRLCSDFPS